MSMKNYNDTIGNRTRDLVVYNAVPQPTVSPRDGPKKDFKFPLINSSYYGHLDYDAV
jgi:hypothetical protein